MSGNPLLLSVAAIALLLACLWSPAGVAANPGEEQVCNVTADHFLGAENYPEAIRLHREVLRKHPESALAHYHLGFAEGMVGDRTQELNEYRRAAALGLSSWDLFLNTGLALFENGSLEAATDALRLAVRLGPDRAESHFNLGLRQANASILATWAWTAANPFLSTIQSVAASHAGRRVTLQSVRR